MPEPRYRDVTGGRIPLLALDAGNPCGMTGGAIRRMEGQWPWDGLPSLALDSGIPCRNDSGVSDRAVHQRTALRSGPVSLDAGNPCGMTGRAIRRTEGQWPWDGLPSLALDSGSPCRNDISRRSGKSAALLDFCPRSGKKLIKPASLVIPDLQAQSQSTASCPLRGRTFPAFSWRGVFYHFPDGQ